MKRWRDELTNEAGFTLPELLMTMVISSIIVGVIASAMIVGLRSTTATSVRLDESHDAQMAAAYFVADASNASTFSAAAPAAGSCATGLTNLAHFQWVDGSATNDVYYVVKDTPSTLVRRACVNDANPVDVSIAKHLAATPVVSCPLPETACSATPADVQLRVQAPSGYTYALRAALRPKAGDGPPPPKIAVYVGAGGMTLKGNSTIFNSSGHLVAVNGNVNACSGSGVNVSDPFLVSGSIDKSCPGGVVSPVPADPLRNIAEPAAPALANPPAANAKDCGTAQKTYQPGRYTTTTSFTSGCLASGVYYLDAGGSFKDMASAPGGVLIYVPPSAADAAGAQNLSFDGAINLGPMATGAQAGITVFLGRNNAGTIATNNSMVIAGIIYAPAGELDLQSNNANLTTGGVDVKTLQFKGNGDQITLI